MMTYFPSSSLFPCQIESSRLARPTLPTLVYTEERTKNLIFFSVKTQASLLRCAALGIKSNNNFKGEQQPLQGISDFTGVDYYGIYTNMFSREFMTLET